MILGISGGQGESFSFEGIVNLDVRPDYELARPAEVRGKCLRTGEDSFVVSGKMRIQLNGLCAKCAQPAQAGLEVDFEEKFRKEPDDDDTYPIEGDKIDLTRALTDNALLNLPGRILCDEGCAGLCQICGANLNDGDCGCIKENDNPFAVLRQLDLPDAD